MIRIPNQSPPTEGSNSLPSGKDTLSFSGFSNPIPTENEDPANPTFLADPLERNYQPKPPSPKNLQDVVFSTVREIYQDAASSTEVILDPSTQQGIEFIEEKRKELHEMLDHLDEMLAGKDLSEATIVFTSLLTLQNQLCLQKTEGITLVRTHLNNFFPALASRSNNPEMRQVVVLIFSPVEIQTIRTRLAEMKEDDALKPFFTMILDQSFDVVQFNEMSGRLLLEMVNYFIVQMEESGYNDRVHSLRFRERYERAKQVFEKSVLELRDMETVILKHLHERPVLEEMPRLLRALIQIRLGTSTSLNPCKIINRISALLNDYTRARMAVAFDFNRLPSFQHTLHLRHSNILNLQKELLEYSEEILNKDIASVQEDLNRILGEIEAGSETLKTGDPEYEEKMIVKSILMKKLEQHRRKVNLIQCQSKIVHVHQQLIQEAIKNYQKQTGFDQDMDEALHHRIKIVKDKTKQSSGRLAEKHGNRMVSQNIKKSIEK